ncbi:MAG: oxygen-insensitive NAD(P)H nitroreductase [Pseudomonadota bacterium]
MTKKQTLTPDTLSAVAKARHTTKAYEETGPLPDDIVAALKDVLQYSPSSTNLQPWHMIMATTDEGKNRVAISTDEKYPFNSGSIRKSSMVVVFAGRLAANEDYMQHILAQEEKDGRYAADDPAVSKERKGQMHGARNMFADIHKHDLKDLQHWMDKQVYLNLGQFMLAAAALGLDTTPMEGIDVQALDKEFGLREKGYSSLAIVCVGQSDGQQDYNAHLPKSRFPQSEIITDV